MWGQKSSPQSNDNENIWAERGFSKWRKEGNNTNTNDTAFTAINHISSFGQKDASNTELPNELLHL